MAAKKGNNIPIEKFALHVKLAVGNPKIELKDDTTPYTSHNGHMFSNFNPSGTFGLRMPAG